MSLLRFSPDCVTGAEEDIVNHARQVIFLKCLVMIHSEQFAEGEN